MKVLRFKLKGQNAFFKKPEFNSYGYFTYGNIHKMVLLGIFGAIIGCKGYGQIRDILEPEDKARKLIQSYPEFYERLSELKVSILPVDKSSKGVISKKIQVFNNSVGYASQEEGGNLIVREQWLEKPKWEICLLLDSQIAETVKNNIVNYKCVYYPYLGTNDHLADILDISVETIEIIQKEKIVLDCFTPEDSVKVAKLSMSELKELVKRDKQDENMIEFKYKESLPYGIDAYTNRYIMRNFIYTNIYLKVIDKSPVYELSDGKRIIFY